MLIALANPGVVKSIFYVHGYKKSRIFYETKCDITEILNLDDYSFQTQIIGIHFGTSFSTLNNFAAQNVILWMK